MYSNSMLNKCDHVVILTYTGAFLEDHVLSCFLCVKSLCLPLKHH